MNAKNERMQILEMIESGRISASQGLALLQALASSEVDEEIATPGELEPIEYELPIADDLPDGDGRPTFGGHSPDDDQSPMNNGAPVTAMDVIPLPAPAQAYSSSNDDEAGGDAPVGEASLSSIPAETVWESYPASPVWEPVQLPLEPPGSEMPPSEERSEPSRQVPFPPADAAKWRRWWSIPLWIGVFITLWGALFMYGSLRSAAGISLWFLCASVPFALGVLVMALGLQCRNAPWLHLRVQQKPGERPERIAISFPLPARPVAWFLHIFGSRISQVRENSLDEIILAVGQNATPENPIYIQVDEDDGEKVEIYIG